MIHNDVATRGSSLARMIVDMQHWNIFELIQNSSSLDDVHEYVVRSLRLSLRQAAVMMVYIAHADGLNLEL